MRVMASAGPFKASAIAGTRAVMIALDCEGAARKGLLGFAFRRSAIIQDLPASQMEGYCPAIHITNPATVKTRRVPASATAFDHRICPYNFLVISG